MLINVKMSTIVGILTFMSMINFMLSGVENDIFKSPTHCLGQIKNKCVSGNGSENFR